VHNDVGITDKSINEIRIANITVHEIEARIGSYGVEIGSVTRIGQSI
jgi:hypothetical protein